MPSQVTLSSISGCLVLFSYYNKFYGLGTNAFTYNCCIITIYHHSITHIDQRLCSITKASTEKWNSLFERSLRKLGLQHNQLSPQSDNSLSIWNYWHLISSQSKPSTPPVLHGQIINPSLNRSNSLPDRFKQSVNNQRSANTLRQTPSSPEPKKSDKERLHDMMKEYLEKVKL